MKKSFKPSTVLSFLTGRLYWPIEELCEILNHMTGKSLRTNELPIAKDYLVQNHLDAIQRDFADYWTKWKHTKNWFQKVAKVDNEFGMVEVEGNVVDEKEFGEYMVENSLLLR